MSSVLFDGKAALLAQGFWPQEATSPLFDRTEFANEISVQRMKLRELLEARLPAVEIVGACALAPLILLRYDAERGPEILEELRSWPQIARVERTLPEGQSVRLQPLENLAPSAVDPGIVGFADLNRPLVYGPWMESCARGAASSPPPIARDVALPHSHVDAVLAAFLEELEPARLPHCLFEGLSREAGPFAWLAAIDRLFCRGAFIVNLSYGRRANEGESGWSGLEWGTELLCRGSGGMVIAAAGQINDSMSKGDRLYLPASAPHVVACADELRAQFTSSNSEASKILLASNINPLGGRRGSSFSAPRISARAVQAYDDLPQRARNVACILAALLASARPSKTLSPGFSDSKRLSRVIARENYRCGHDESRLVLPVTSGSPLRLALSWRESEFDPVLRVLAARDQQVLRRTGQWMVMDFLPTDSRLEIKGVTGPWSLAWHPLSSEEFSRSMSGAESLEGGS